MGEPPYQHTTKKMSVIIEDIIEQEYYKPQTQHQAPKVDVDAGEHKPQQHRPVKRTVSQNIQKKMEIFRKIYTEMHKARVEREFMYMMLTGHNPQDRHHFISTLSDSLKRNFVETETEKGLDENENAILDRIVACNDADGQDAFWFFSMLINNGLKDWILGGDPAKGVQPPVIGDPKMFAYFTRSSAFESMCDDILNGAFDVPGFAIAMRTEFGLTVGFNPLTEVMDTIMQQQQQGQ